MRTFDSNASMWRSLIHRHIQPSSSLYIIYHNLSAIGLNLKMCPMSTKWQPEGDMI